MRAERAATLWSSRVGVLEMGGFRVVELLKAETPELAERCDGCGAAAKLKVVLAEGGELTFCGHHANLYGAEMARLAVRVVVEAGFHWQHLTALHAKPVEQNPTQNTPQDTTDLVTRPA